MAVDIMQQRVRAAESTGGGSGDVIYAMIERVIEEHKLTGRILDYGSGVGQLTRRLLAMNRFDSVTAADIMKAPEDLAPAVEWIEQDLNSMVPGYTAAFDIVVSAEVIEHLENPRFTVREFFRLLRPGGTVIITTPNNESIRSLIALYVRGHFAAFGTASYPAHITALLRTDITRILLEAGFHEPDLYFTNQGGIPCKPGVTWQNISLGLFRGIRFSDNFMAIATKPG
jgi:2-polyprenyl-3-methyl-5-hydroxy-6-metoxy-1,4-benzoquinol methylase